MSPQSFALQNHYPSNEDVFDATGLACVSLLFQLRKRLSSMEAGQRLVVIASDPTSIYDIPAWCHLMNYVHHGYEKVEENFHHRIGVTDESNRSTTGTVWAKRLNNGHHVFSEHAFRGNPK